MAGFRWEQSNDKHPISTIMAHQLVGCDWCELSRQPCPWQCSPSQCRIWDINVMGPEIQQVDVTNKQELQEGETYV